MPRPKKGRRICGSAAHHCFKPNGVPLSKLKKISILPEELEALRLADYLNMSQQQAAEQMAISRQTFGNIVNQARYKVAASLIEGGALLFDDKEQNL
ncbi:MULTISPECIES: DUF134 domain-containing protein [Agarivorans]|jgi:predicted DNA-binding protein (UPF0251 family)|uniref:UPF0251 protein GCM10007414_19210 n=1 Tax=Agarivorans gilvus TaxID=680279 RepID=A0ABQ1I2B7_9ALTE|nr:DUF134 domain-containing protein [Agarivorans gilvus]GGB06053.1 UPF0251 protein [Agarivorans gilvus]